MLIIGLFLLLLVSAISAERINGIIINRQASLILLYSFIIAVETLNVSAIGSGIGVFGGLYQVDVLSKVMECFIYIIAAIILPNTLLLTKKLNGQMNWLKSEYSLIALFTIVGAILLIYSNDLVSMYLSIELQSFSLYVLASIYRDSQSATYAGLKYFLLGGLSSGFILLGSTIIYSSVGLTNLESIYLISSTVSQLTEINSQFISLNALRSLEIGLAVMTVGFLFKVSAAPFHNWAPDVYDGVPTKVTTWLAVMAKISIFTFLLNITVKMAIISVHSFNSFSSLIILASLLSLIIGTVVGLAQTRIKRLLAYSTISHVGFLLLALAINKEDSIESFIFYLIQYSLTSANAFFILMAFGLTASNISNSLKEQEYSQIQYISQLAGSFSSANNSNKALLALAMAVVLFSTAGIPPLVGFFAKQAVLLSAVQNGFIFLALIGIVTSVISAAYYLRVIKVMIFDKAPNLNLFASSIIEEDRASKNTEMSNSLSFSISVLTFLILFFLCKPQLILSGAHIIALNLFYV